MPLQDRPGDARIAAMEVLVEPSTRQPLANTVSMYLRRGFSPVVAGVISAALVR
jgi:hypothetical protein